MEKQRATAVVARNLRQLREGDGLTLREVSERLGHVGHPMAVSVVSKVENGDRRIDVDDLAAFAEVYGVAVSELFAGVGGQAELVDARDGFVELNYDIEELLGEVEAQMHVFKGRSQFLEEMVAAMQDLSPGTGVSSRTTARPPSNQRRTRRSSPKESDVHQEEEAQER